MHMIQVIQINRTKNKGNKRRRKRGKKGGRRKKEETQLMETGQKSSFYRLTFYYTCTYKLCNECSEMFTGTDKV